MKHRILCLPIIGALVAGTTLDFTEGDLMVSSDGSHILLDTSGSSSGHLENREPQKPGRYHYYFDENGNLKNKVIENLE